MAPTPAEIKAAFDLLREALTKTDPSPAIREAITKLSAVQASPIAHECSIVCAMLQRAISPKTRDRARNAVLREAIDREMHVLGAVDWTRVGKPNI